MKKITFIAFMVVFGCLAAHGQFLQNAISGQFRMTTLAATGENVHVFSGQNNTGSVLHVTGVAANAALNQQRSASYVLLPGQSFFFGPAEGWLWVPGETFTVFFSDGTRQSWVFNQRGFAPPPFQGNIGGPCKFRNDRVGCRCNHYVPRGGRWGNVCVCNHSLAAHDVR